MEEAKKCIAELDVDKVGLVELSFLTNERAGLESADQSQVTKMTIN